VTVPRCPIAWIEAVRAEHHVADKGHAQVNGMDAHAYRSAAQIRITDMLSGAQIRMRLFRDALTEWLAQGEYLTMWDGVRTLSDEHRRQREAVEEHVLGVSHGAPPSSRPRYAYVANSDERCAELNSYGFVVVTLDDDIADRSTVVFGDSIGSTNGAETRIIAPEPLHATMLPCRYGWHDILPVATIADACDQRYRYAEVQIYGPLVPRDIVEVLFCCGVRATDELRVLMDRHGLVYDEIEDLP
jgi:hypothetical protein